MKPFENNLSQSNYQQNLGNIFFNKLNLIR
jgi:hypothetical protein